MSEVTKVPFVIRQKPRPGVLTPMADIDKGWAGYKVYLSHDEVESISNDASSISLIIPDPSIAAAVNLVALALRACDALGGYAGVTIVGSWLTPANPVILPGRQ
jgi:hypothetical protein